MRRLVAVAGPPEQVRALRPDTVNRLLEPTEPFVQIIEYRWRLSEPPGRDAGLARAVQSYLADILTHRPDAQAVLGYAVVRRRGHPVITAEVPVNA